jgi:hypothetical protein
VVDPQTEEKIAHGLRPPWRMKMGGVRWKGPSGVRGWRLSVL